MLHGEFDAFGVVNATRDETFIAPTARPTTSKRVLKHFGVETVIIGTCVAPHIKAVLSAPITTYRLVDLPATVDASFVWTGTDCGSVSGTRTDTLVWSHNCNHVGIAHPTTMIMLRITIGDIELRCTYTSARTGSGPPCTPVE